ncbi:nuclear factor of activated T-cells, cytoplasmic 2 isoform X1 [Scleropages formosus]|uniref:nuclear factor of activated T-cells, cytoplasmic 2 isoform X1 n=1 Tax=Scleropages formosus TaxID=113540 RepID=UPI0010FAB7B1|nr:nuclear factor of activated T-cells, cytoplasmic 2-like isoform X1 [Scleropages formosus]
MNSVCKDKEASSVTFVEDLGQGDLNFDDLFTYGQSYGDAALGFSTGEAEESSLFPQGSHSPPPGTLYPHEGDVDVGPCSRSLRGRSPLGVSGGYEENDYLEHSGIVGGGPSPRIEITLTHEQHHHGSLGAASLTVPSHSLPVPRPEGGAYRETACPSPASSNSSTSWHSENLSPWASPCVSPGGASQIPADFRSFHIGSPHAGSPHTSPVGSPRARSPSPHPGSRSNSPQGKRTYAMYSSPTHSRSPSPRGGGGHTPILPGTNHSTNGIETFTTGSVPTKVVKTHLEYPGYVVSQPEPSPSSCPSHLRSTSSTEAYYVINSFLPSQVFPSSIPMVSLPPLEWPIPSRQDPYELRVEVQPRHHHRAQYETEGSRGAVKALAGGHPVVQLHGYRGHEPLGLQIFIGTADERMLKPHAFYQVQRITGKSVNTVSLEKMINGTKVLEIPLEPKNNMTATIDCAGILKLKNADIEMRKGETDVGRKNTCVRLVFRIHIPQPGGQYISLQTASDPIECSQRSAHELPMVEKQDMESCSVLGGQRMILTGQNFTSDSKVVFSEKTREGHHIWKAEATVDKAKSQANMLFVEIPSYRDPAVSHQVKVNFYVINGKKKRSQPQHFTYTPLAVSCIKTEPLDDYLQSQVSGMSSHAYYHNSYGFINTDGCLLTSMAPCQQVCSIPAVPDPTLQEPNAGAVYPQSGKSLYQRPILIHAGSPSLSSSAAPSTFQLSASSHLLTTSAPSTELQHATCVDGYGQATAGTNVMAYSTVAQPQPRVRASLGPANTLRGPAPEELAPAALEKVTIKQENLDQAYLDDVNDIIRKDLTVHRRGQT